MEGVPRRPIDSEGDECLTDGSSYGMTFSSSQKDAARFATARWILSATAELELPARLTTMQPRQSDPHTMHPTITNTTRAGDKKWTTPIPLAATSPFSCLR